MAVASFISENSHELSLKAIVADFRANLSGFMQRLSCRIPTD